MIAFHGDSLVPAELCRLLYLTVPDELHVPVVFHNRPTFPLSRGLLGACNGDQIHVNLNKVYDAALWRRNPGAPTVRVWRTLLETAYHEFGHVATWREIEAVGDAYMSDRGDRYIEGIADEWKDQRLAMLLEHDGRLAQPRLLTGYLGLLVARLVNSWHECLMGRRQGVGVAGSVRANFVREVRCRRTGSQLSAGDALANIGLPRSAYWALRRLSADVGIDYTDSAGRRHKLYTWGDLPILAERFRRLSPLFVGAYSGTRWRADSWPPEASSAGRPDPVDASELISEGEYKPWEMGEPCLACDRVAWTRRPEDGCVCGICDPDPTLLSASDDRVAVE